MESTYAATHAPTKIFVSLIVSEANRCTEFSANRSAVRWKNGKISFINVHLYSMPPHCSIDFRG